MERREFLTVAGAVAGQPHAECGIGNGNEPRPIDRAFPIPHSAFRLRPWAPRFSLAHQSARISRLLRR